MEILFVSHKFPPATGGMEKQSYELITGMKKLCKVHSIVYDGRGSILLFFLTLQWKIARLCKENPGISVIHYNDGLMAAFCLWHRRYPQLKRTVTLHGLDVVFPSKIYHRHIFPKFNSFHSLIAVSRATLEKSVEHGISRDKLTVINNGVTEPLSDEPQAVSTADWLSTQGIDAAGKCILVMMGRPVLRKGFSWFLSNVLPRLKGDFLVLMIGPFQAKMSLTERLVDILPAKLRNKLMLFLGYPSDQATIRKLLSNPEISRSVKHLGKIPGKDVEIVRSGCHAFLMPNISVAGDMEGFGLVCLEAAAMGAIVYAAEIDGITDAVIEGKNGFLLPSADAAQWAARLNTLIAFKSDTRELRKAFKKYTVEQYSWDKMVNEYFLLFSGDAKQQQELS